MTRCLHDAAAPGVWLLKASAVEVTVGLPRTPPVMKEESLEQFNKQMLAEQLCSDLKSCRISAKSDGNWWGFSNTQETERKDRNSGLG
jgi:hypothetical protein